MLMNTRLSPGRQRGAVALLVALMLLIAGTIIAFFANRGFIFEQRTSANQYRAVKAFELAEAGVDWALGKLNEGLPLTAAPSCVPLGSGTNPTFRERYATPTASDPTHATGWLSVVSNTVVGCRISAAGVATCGCPAAGVALDLGTGNPEEGRFGVRFQSVAGDPAAIEVIARGCTNGNATCEPNANSTADATAIVRVLVKIVPSVPSGPAAALTTGSATVVGGNLNVINTYAPSNGITIHAGTTVQTGSGAAVYTLPGTPPRASILDNDPSLQNLTLASEDAFFANFFGETLTNYRTVNPDVIRISGCSATDCGAQVMSYINSGIQNPRFYVDGDITFNNGNVGSATIGSAGNSVIIVSSGTMELRSNLTAYGMFYAATATATDNWDFAGSGTATIYGAFISRGDFVKGSGTLNLIYDPSLWGGAGAPTGRLVRVPGSWRDKLTDF